MDNSFGKKIQYLREKNDMTQRELATKINISFSVMSRIESGDRAARDEEIIKIAKALNVSTDYLLGNSDIENPYEKHERISESIKNDKELLEFWEVLKEREDLQLMFKQTKNMSPKDIRQIIKIIKAIEDEEDAQN